MAADDGRPTVRCYSQDGERRRDFDLSVLALPTGLRDAMVARTAPGAGLTSMESFVKVYLTLRHFDRYLQGLDTTPQQPDQVGPKHFDGFYDYRRARGLKCARADLVELRQLLLRTPGISDALAGRLAGVMPARLITKPIQSYSRVELRRIAEAARADAARGRGPHPREPRAAAAVP